MYFVLYKFLINICFDRFHRYIDQKKKNGMYAITCKLF